MEKFSSKYLALILSKEFPTRPLKFEKVAYHHITIAFDLSTWKETEIIDFMRVPHRVSIIGYAANDGIEALVVSVDELQFRRDEKRFHITVSYKSPYRPVHANDLIADENNIQFNKPTIAIPLYAELLQK